MIRRLVLCAFSLIMIIFIVLMIFIPFKQAIILIIPVSVCIFGITIIVGLINFIAKQFNEKFNKEKKLFLEELNETKDYYHGGTDE